MMYTLASAVFRHGRERPDAVAIACQGDTVTYGHLADRACRLAARLKAAAGWGRRDGRLPRVGILASRGIDACAGVLAASWAGATYVPIGLKSPEERIITLLDACDCSAVIADAAGARLLTDRVLSACPPLVIHSGPAPRAAPPDGVDLAAAASLPSAVITPPESIEADDVAYIIFTSGTTGVPKGVVISAASVRHYITMITGYLGLGSDDRVLESCELNFDFSVHNMFATWEAGAALHILPAAGAMNAVKFAQQSGLTVWNSVPSLAGMLRQLKVLQDGCLPGLRLTVFGGEQLPAGTVAAWQRAAPNSAIFNLYGPAEATVFCLGQLVTSPVPLTPGRDVVSIGTPLPGSEAAVVDGDGRPVPADTLGELAIGGVQVAVGYLGDAGLTGARFPVVEGRRWYLTGDVALEDRDGRFHCFGRTDNQVKIRGHRIELEEIDSHLRTVTGAQVVGTVAFPIADGMPTGIVSFIGTRALDADTILADLKTRVPPYMIPNRLIALETIPTNHSGKVDRHALRRLLEAEG